MRAWFPVVAVVSSLAGCASVPASLSGGTFSDVTPQAAQARSIVNVRVRWGGEIVETQPGKGETCFDVVSRPLNAEARPELTDVTLGRFMACATGFYDPAVYAKGRQITVVGTLEAPVLGKIGEYSYRYPQVKAATVYLWPRYQYYYYMPPPYYGGWPYYGPWPYYR